MNHAATAPKEIWLFTTAYPYGLGEPYLEAEVQELARRFERVVIVPLNAEGRARSLPQGVQVLHWPASPVATIGLGGLFRMPRIAVRLLREARGSGARAMPWRDAFNLTRQVLNRVVMLRRTLLKDRTPGATLLYAYWLFDQAAMLAVLHTLDPRWRAVARVHGFDLFPARSPWGHFPFRDLTVAQLDAVYAPSAHALGVLRAAHPDHAGKFHLARLGTSDQGAGPWSPAPVLRVVSCSNLVELKRVDRIVEALARVNAPVEWTHFGDGPEQARITELVQALPSNVRADLRGGVPNAAVLAHYRGRPVDLFLHLSRTEGGVPVALQEAASFGIPLVAADAGGVAELVGARTGILLPADPTAAAVAQVLDSFIGGPLHSVAAREGVRAVWASAFRAEANYGHFCDLLLRP